MDLPELNKPCFVVWACTSHEDYEKITPRYFGKETFVFEGPSGIERCANLAAVTRFEPLKTEAGTFGQLKYFITNYDPELAANLILTAGWIKPKILTAEIARKLWRDSLINFEDMTVTDIEGYAKKVAAYVRGDTKA